MRTRRRLAPAVMVTAACLGLLGYFGPALAAGHGGREPARVAAASSTTTPKGVTAPTAVSGGLGTTAAPVAAPSGTWTMPPAAYGEGGLHNAGVTMADGTVIRADVYYPTAKCAAKPCAGGPAPGSFPVLLEQTPYGKGNLVEAGSMFGSDIPTLVEQGYVVVLSDVRGTGDSGGSWALFEPAQATDGATLARWAADELGGSGPNGIGISAAVPGLHVDRQVGLFGESYMGINQFLTVAALDATPGANPVTAMFPIIAGNDLYRDEVTEGGLFNTEFSVAYVALVNSLSAANPAFDTLEGLNEASSQGNLTPNAFIGEASGIPATEVTHAGAVTRYDLPTLLNIETGGDESYDANEGLGTSAYWAQRSPVNVLGELVRDHIPAFLVGGWNDLFQRGELMNYTGLQNAWYDATTGATESITGPMAARQPTTPRYQLLMGPWMHITTGAGSNLTADEVQWFDSWLIGPAHQTGTPIESTHDPLHLFELDSGQWDGTQHTGSWLDTSDWPVALPGGSGYAATRYYFGPAGGGGRPALSDNQGSLTTTAPTTVSGADPVAWLGASNPCNMNTDQWGAGAASEGQALGGSGFAFPCAEDDVTYGTGPGALTYTSAPMKAAQVLAGPIDATVFASATTTEAEFVADIEAVSPQGVSMPLTSGALLGSLRAVDTSKTWMAADGSPLSPFHFFTTQSQQAVVPGKVTEYDLEVFPTFALIPSGWSIRITLSTSDTPHVFPTPVQAAHLLGGLYQVQRNKVSASFLNLPLVPESTFSTACPPSICTSSR